MSENNWTPTPLGEILEIKYGKDHKHLANGEFPVYGSGGIMRYAEKPIYDKPSILIPRKGTLSNLFYVDKPFWSVDTMFYTKIDETNNSKFIYYFLKTLDLAALNVGSAVPSLTTEVLNNVEIKLPNRETQDKIASILSSLDDKIELNNQMNQTLEQIAQAIFKEWFVDFNFPGFDGNLVNGFPKGWRKGKTLEICDITDFVANGSFASLKENVNLLDKEDFALYVRTTDHNNKFVGNLKYVDESSFNFLKKSELKGNEVIISNVGDVGTVFRPPVWLGKPMTLGSNAIMIVESIYNHFLYYYLSSSQGQHSISGIVSGSAQLKFNKTSFRNMEILIPDEGVVQKFNDFYEPLFNKIIQNRAEVINLSKIRNLLLPNLLNSPKNKF